MSSEESEILPRGSRHLGLYIAGLPDSGKSTLIEHLALADIEAGYGCCVIDPTGQLIRHLIHHLPADRLDDIILFDSAKPVAIDFFSYDENLPHERTTLTDMLVNIFKFHDNAPRAEPNLENILGTLFDANENGIPDKCTFFDIINFIKYKKRRDEILKYTPDRKAEWDAEPPTPSEYLPITKRLSKFTNNNVLRTMFSAKNPKVNIADVLEKQRVLLVRLRQTKSDYDLAALIVAKFRQAIFALGELDIDEEDRTPYYLYVDECHEVLKFATDDFDTILTGARKYKLCLALVNQRPVDLPSPIRAKLELLQASVLFRLRNPESAAPFKHLFPTPHTPKNRSYELYTLEDKYRDVEAESEALWRTWQEPNKDDDWDDKVSRRKHNEKLLSKNQKLGDRSVDLIRKITHLKHEIADDEALAFPDLIATLSNLKRGEAIYVPIDGTPFVALSKEPLEKHNADDCYENVLNHTLENWGDKTPIPSYTEKDVPDPPLKNLAPQIEASGRVERPPKRPRPKGPRRDS